MTANTELLARGYRAMSEGDIATVLAMIDPSITIWPTEDLPWGGHFEGIDGFAEFFGKLRETITSQVEVEQIFEAGVHVVQVDAPGAPSTPLVPSSTWPRRTSGRSVTARRSSSGRTSTRRPCWRRCRRSLFADRCARRTGGAPWTGTSW